MNKQEKLLNMFSVRKNVINVNKYEIRRKKCNDVL